MILQSDTSRQNFGTNKTKFFIPITWITVAELNVVTADRWERAREPPGVWAGAV